MQYLLSDQEYLNRYDLFTVKRCLEEVEMFQKVYDESLKSEKVKDVSKREKYRTVNQLMYFQLCFIQADRYKRKRETIQKWIEEDKIKQEKYDNTSAPVTYCPDCKTHMAVSSKFLEDYMNKPLRMLFFLDCLSCKKRLALYEDGEEHVSKPQLCPKCNKEVKVTHKRKGNTLTWKTTCATCGYKETSVDDFDKMRKEREAEEQKEKELLEKYRAVCCLSDEIGQKYLDNIEAIEFSHEIFEEEKQKYDNTAYQQVTQLKKLSVVELEKILSELLEKEKYIKLSFNNPELGQHIYVPFTVQDCDLSRRENISISDLQKLIKESLKDTNWRLSEGITYRLGYLSGRLRGYETEGELMSLYEQKKEHKPKIDESKRMKYSTNNWVQFARMSGEHEGIKAMRKKRLEKEPEGFFLEADKGGYTCGICGDSFYGNDIWWNEFGLRCRKCWKNIKEGVIPSLSHDDKKTWMSKFDLEYHYGIHPSSIRKLRKEGVLVGRDLKSEAGYVYCTVYLVSENSEFLKKYPRKEEKQGQMLVFSLDGKLAGLPEPEEKSSVSNNSEQLST